MSTVQKSGKLHSGKGLRFAPHPKGGSRRGGRQSILVAPASIWQTKVGACGLGISDLVDRDSGDSGWRAMLQIRFTTCTTAWQSSS